MEGDVKRAEETEVRIHIARPGAVRHGWVWKVWKNPKTNHWERTFAVITGEPNELMQPIHDRMTTFLEPRDYAEYLEPSDRPPLHLLRILPSKNMHASLLEKSSITNRQVSLFDSQ